MASLTWHFGVEGDRHTLHLKHGYWSGKRVITLDGETIVNEIRFLDWGSNHTFTLGDHHCLLRIRHGLLFEGLYDFEFLLDGQSIPHDRRNEAGDELLRASSIPQGKPETLLRPARFFSAADTDNLLRADLEPEAVGEQ